jgi:hypothetical protein
MKNWAALWRAIFNESGTSKFVWGEEAEGEEERGEIEVTPEEEWEDSEVGDSDGYPCWLVEAGCSAVVDWSLHAEDWLLITGVEKLDWPEDGEVKIFATSDCEGVKLVAEMPVGTSEVKVTHFAGPSGVADGFYTEKGTVGPVLVSGVWVAAPTAVRQRR